ncbi:biotin/lipoyl-binding protein [Anaerotignum sp.]|uniref:biotin/lipoyl-binding protein n=1 Tax=Anaerotignum sp. TaxID=2039241 RepID=UPI002714B31D|nr:biotin/lipoyl-binding protein [Anaerotignum sp.]
MQNSLFRKSSIENISSPERLNEYIKITNPGVWGILMGCLILMIAIILWAFYGNIPNTVSAKGIIFPQKGVVSAIPFEDGRINDMRVKVGDYVEAGQILAVISQDSILDQIKEFKNSGLEDEEKLQELYSLYERNSLVVSPVSGIVLYARNTNETVSSTEAIARIVKQDKYSDNMQVVCYINSETAKKLMEGMEVQVSPQFAQREEYGFMYGHITSIGTYPVSLQDTEKSLGNQQYAEDLLTQNNSVEVRVTLTVDGNSQNGIKWSNIKGEAIPLSIGTYTNMRIIVKNYKPYELVF